MVPQIANRLAEKVKIFQFDRHVCIFQHQKNLFVLQMLFQALENNSFVIDLYNSSLSLLRRKDDAQCPLECDGNVFQPIRHPRDLE